MALIPCAECGRDVSDKAQACPNCGHPVALTLSAETSATEQRPEDQEYASTQTQTQTQSWFGWFVVPMAAVALIGGAIFIFNSGSGSGGGSTTLGIAVVTSHDPLALAVTSGCRAGTLRTRDAFQDYLQELQEPFSTEDRVEMIEEMKRQCPEAFTGDMPTFADFKAFLADGTVKYEVTGTARRAGLTLQNDSGGTDQIEVSVPWSKSYHSFESRDFVYVSAQNDGETGTLSCAIYVDGRKVFSGSANGAYAICTASGALP